MLAVNFFSVIFIVILYSIMFSCVGMKLLGNTIKELSSSLVWAVSFFCGMAVFLSTLRLSTQIFTHYHFCFYLISLIFLYFTILELRQTKKNKQSFHTKTFLSLFCIFLLLFLYHISIGGNPNLEELKNPFYSFGSLHTIRYANIASYIILNDCIPVINQSYAQSILGSFCYLFNLKNPVYCISVWLTITKLFTIIFCYGIARTIKFNRLLSAIFSIIAVSSNEYLSLGYVLSIDSGSPFLLNMYTDSLAGVCTFVISLFLIKKTIPPIL